MASYVASATAVGVSSSCVFCERSFATSYCAPATSTASCSLSAEWSSGSSRVFRVEFSPRSLMPRVTLQAQRKDGRVQTEIAQLPTMAMRTVFANSNPFYCSTWPGSGLIEVHRRSDCSTRQSRSVVALSGIGCISGRVEFGQLTRLRNGARDVRVCGRRGRAGGRPAKTNISNGTIVRGGGGSSLQQEQELRTKKTKQEEEDEEEEALAEAALEALFAQLEKDLEDENMSEDDEDDEDFTEEEVMALEDELEAALMGVEYNPRNTTASISEGDTSNAEYLAEDGREPPNEEEEEEEDEDEEQRVVSLERWQLKKLAAAAEIGRRHVNVKALAAELGMDRSDVLAWLKNPPPELLMVGASMGLEDDSGDPEEEDANAEVAATVSSSKDSGSSAKQNAGSQGLAPVTWHSQKRLRKEHLATFERVFRRTRRPTNAMIQNLVELTHVPRKRIVEWFDQKRKELDPSKSFESLR
ncbi:hypothetical protein R1sor_003106 [Riccia sorocarpa]|uniref:Homeobox domain-containing protein n=1 Tax=Riccia sorocarpa TaxID=122646 RepID=A0ABD3H6S2_9MARC